MQIPAFANIQDPTKSAKFSSWNDYLFRSGTN